MDFKKTFIYFSVIPVIIALLNFYFSSYQFFRWGYEYNNEIGFVALAIAGLNCLFIIYRNASTKTHSKFWYIFAGLMAIIFFGYLYFSYSLSNAGF